MPSKTPRRWSQAENARLFVAWEYRGAVALKTFCSRFGKSIGRTRQAVYARLVYLGLWKLPHDKETNKCKKKSSA